MTNSNITIGRYVTEKNLIKKYDNWVLALRPNQITCYSMMLFADSDSEKISDLNSNTLKDLGVIFADVERCIRLISAPLKFNYYSLMLTDPNVHFHIFPRFSDPELDEYWPKMIDLQREVPLDELEMAGRLKKLKDIFL
jgi:diadenosine tetraphosphate (Ap4A) HIT family hydrolase